MQMSTSDKQAFVSALDQAKRTVHPDLVICTRRYRNILRVTSFYIRTGFVRMKKTMLSMCKKGLCSFGTTEEQRAEL